MKRILTLLVLMVAIVAVAAMINLPSLLGLIPSSSTGPGAGSAAPTTIERPADAEELSVDYVHDGDTLFLIPTDGERLKVRLIGVDTPEVGENAECFGDEATGRLRQILPEGSTVWASADEEALDRYGRSLLYLWTSDGAFVNLDLVADGYGTALRIKPNDAHWAELSAAEAQAQGAGLGLWGSC